jgi:hypothetical protein
MGGFITDVLDFPGELSEIPAGFSAGRRSGETGTVSEGDEIV